jgi:CMP-N,N'-diacetyllegionaminic acid synthase
MNSSLLCTICARKGSKGVRNKNLRSLNGKPLICHTIEQAISAGLLDQLAVSTDSEEILEIANKYSVPHLIKRPDYLATDVADKLDAIVHAVSEVESKTNHIYSEILDLDPTSPLRLPEDILNSLRLFRSSGAENLITAAPSRKSPYFNLVEIDNLGFAHLSKNTNGRILRRQDSPKCFDMNASIYIWDRNFLFKNKHVFGNRTALYTMPESRSIDIDTELDFQFVEFLMGANSLIKE